MSNTGWSSGQAVCAVHLEAQATGTCERCGNYVCETCTEYGTHSVCPPCRERVGLVDFRLERAVTDFGNVFSTGWTTFTGQWLPLSLASLTYFGISFAFGFCSNLLQGALLSQGPEAASIGIMIGLGVGIAQNVVCGIVLLGMIHMSFRALEGRAPQLGEVFSQASRIVPWIGQAIIIGLVIGTPVVLAMAIPIGIGIVADAPDIMGIGAFVLILLLAFPLAYVGLGISLGQFELVYDPDVGPIEALKRSWQLADGYRWTILGTSVVGVLLMIGGMLLCCVGVIPATALLYLLMATLHKALRNGSGLPEPTRHRY